MMLATVALLEPRILAIRGLNSALNPRSGMENVKTTTWVSTKLYYPNSLIERAIFIIGQRCRFDGKDCCQEGVKRKRIE